jgi:hypothetical protein
MHKEVGPPSVSTEALFALVIPILRDGVEP